MFRIIKFMCICALLAGCGQRGRAGSERGETVVGESAMADGGTSDNSPNVPEAPEAPGASQEGPGEERDDPCDVDGDGFYDLSCGGNDCNDASSVIHPGAVEFCNFVDENCNDILNDGVECQVYAHTSTQLYLVDPFLGTRDWLGSIPVILDFDTDIQGNLYGITDSYLCQFDEIADDWNSVGTFGEMDGSTNGFAINSLGRGFATSGNSLYTIQLETGVAELVGQFGSDFNSSGDCVVNKSDELFVSSDHDPESDYLVLVNTITGEGRSIGRIGFKDVYGLTAAWGIMFGFTGNGEVIRIDENTGEGELIHTFTDRSWWGAASSPNR